MDRVDESEGSKAIALKAIRGVFIERDARVVQELAVDIFRVDNGRLVEHRDVMQAEVPAHETRSKNAMFTS
jgi:predicted SnoaL-like aldol condensation-catalyzing enzyme